MKICKKCVQPDTRPGIKFNREVVCPPCQFAAKRGRIDWKKRHKKLEELARFGREHNVSGYDCIVAVSGGKDSMRQAMYMRDELGLKVLLVSCAYPPEHVTEEGPKNLANLIELGFDCITETPSPQVWKKMVKRGFYKHGNILKSCEMSLFVSAPKVAIAYHIPLICYGENPATALGSLEVGSVTWDANSIKRMNTLKGGPDAVKTKDITEKDLFWYRYPSDDEMEWAHLKIFYLGYFMEDFTRYKNGQFAVRHGMRVRPDNPRNTGSYYNFEAVDNDFSVVNQTIKYFKYGFGRTTHQMGEAVRLGSISRKRAIEIVKKYDGRCADKYIEKFCRYINITKKEFWRVANSYRNREIWEKDKQGNWRLKREF